MNNYKILAVAFVLAAFSLPALANGETAKRSLKSVEKMKTEIYSRIGNLKMVDFDYTDASVEVVFYVNADGDVAVTSVNGNCCVANSHVAQMLKSRKMYVAPELQNTKHEVKVRYVVL